MFGINIITFHMSGGEVYKIKTNEDTDEYLDGIQSGGFVEIAESILININQISSIEIEHKIIDL